MAQLAPNLVSVNRWMIVDRGNVTFQFKGRKILRIETPGRMDSKSLRTNIIMNAAETQSVTTDKLKTSFSSVYIQTKFFSEMKKFPNS